MSKLRVDSLESLTTGHEILIEDFEKQGLVVKTKEQLKQALTKLGANDGTIIITDVIYINENITIPENVMLKFVKGGKLTVNSGCTLTLDCAIDAGLFQIFDGNGIVTGNPKIDAVYPEWFGASPAVTDNSSALLAADALSDEIIISDNLKFEANLRFTSKVTIVGNGKLTSSGNYNLIFEGGFTAPFKFVIDTGGYVQFKKTEKIIAQWFGADGEAVYTSGSITAGSTTLSLKLAPGNVVPNFKDGETIFVNGAGVDGGLLATTIASGGGTLTLTLSDSAITSTANAEVSNRNHTKALQRLFASTKGALNTGLNGASQPADTGTTEIYFPKGCYCSFDTVNVYSGTIIKGEQANVLGGSILVQCDISKPLINVIADNFDENGNSLNGGNGNNIFETVVFKSAKADDSKLNAPVVYFQYAWNLHSDTQFNKCVWQNTAGACIGAGFETTGTISSGSTSLSLADGSVFRSNGSEIGGSKIIIKGAGVGGADLETFIVSGGGTGSVIINDPASTSVTNAIVYPQREVIDPIEINSCEFDVVREGFRTTSNVQGHVIFNDIQAFKCVRGLIRNTSVNDIGFTLEAGCRLNGCGNPLNSELTYRYSIYFNSGGVTAGFLNVNDAVISRLDEGTTKFGGALKFVGRCINFIDNRLEDIDNAGYAKFAQITADEIVFDGNRLISHDLADYTNSRVVSFTNPSGESYLSAKGNIFINTSGSAISRFFHSDYPMSNTSFNFSGNDFYGLVSQTFDLNISNLRNQTLYGSNTYGPFFGISTTPPTAGFYKVGDIVWNSSVPNVAGAPVGWVCVASGSPGTWREFGVTGNLA